MQALPPELYEYLRRSARTHLATFVRLVWDVVNPGVPLRWNWHLDMICEHLEALSRREIRSLVISLPPGSCKSTLVGQCWPCWDWLQHPEYRWIFATNSLENARKEATYRRSIITSDIYADMDPPFALQKAGKRVQVLRNAVHGEFRATSTGTSITGAHFDYQVIDDPNDAQRIAPEELEAVNTWYDEVLSTRCRDNAATVLIQQRLAAGDLVGHMLDLGVDASIVLPALYDEDVAAQTSTPLDWHDPRTQRGELLWPDRQDEEFLLHRRHILGSLAFSAQYQQRPQLAGGAMFRAAWWHRHDAGGMPERAGQWLITVDTASSLRDSADLTVVQCWILTEDGMAWLMEQQSGHWEINEQARRVRVMCAKYPLAKKVAIEERNGGFGLCAVLRDDLMRIHRVLWRWKSQVPKVDRISAMAPSAENGQISIPLDAEGDAFINQASEFPAGRHDDMIDAAAIAIDIWRRRLTGLAPAPDDIPEGGSFSATSSIRTGSSRYDDRAPLRRAPQKR